MGKSRACDGWPPVSLGQRSAVAGGRVRWWLPRSDGARWAIPQGGQSLWCTRYGGAGVGVDNLHIAAISLRPARWAGAACHSGTTRGAGGGSSASPAERLTATFREIISSARQATGHAYI